jgi:hypothetical protein
MCLFLLGCWWIKLSCNLYISDFTSIELSRAFNGLLQCVLSEGGTDGDKAVASIYTARSGCI